MKRCTFFLTTVACGASLVTLFIGCGGNDSSRSAGRFSSSTNSSDSELASKKLKAVPIFLTESSTPTANHIWVQIFEIKANTAKTPITVFSDPKGIYIDLCALNKAGSPLSLFLGAANIDPKETLVRASFTVGNTYFIQEKADKPNEKKLFASQSSDPENRATFKLELKSSDKYSETHPLVVDFNLRRLSQGSDNKSILTLRTEPSKIASNIEKQLASSFDGTVTSSKGTGADLSFTLNSTQGSKFLVNGSSATKTYCCTGDPNPLVTNEKGARITGIFDIKKNAYIANSILIKDPEHSGTHHSMLGIVQKFKATPEAITITPSVYSTIAPSLNNLVKLRFTENAQLLNEHGKTLTKAEFAKQVTPKTEVIIDAIHDSTDKNIKVRWIKINETKLEAKIKPVRNLKKELN